MPFGLTNALTFFMDMMNKIFRPYLDQLVAVFVDDIPIYSLSKAEHKRHPRISIQLLREHKSYANISKCDFLLMEVKLGLSLTLRGLKQS